MRPWSWDQNVSPLASILSEKSWFKNQGGPLYLGAPACYSGRTPLPGPPASPIEAWVRAGRWRGGGGQDPYPEEGRFDFAAVLPGLLVHDGVEDVLGRDAGVRHAPVVAHHPDEHIWDAVLRLGGGGREGEHQEFSGSVTCWMI